MDIENVRQTEKEVQERGGGGSELGKKRESEGKRERERECMRERECVSERDVPVITKLFN